MGSKARGSSRSAMAALVPVGAYLLVLGALGGLLVACGTAAGSDPTAQSGTKYHASGIQATIPRGWHLIDRRISDVTYPVQVLAVASYPVHLSAPQAGCYPREALAQMPENGALLQIVNYTRGLPGAKHGSMPHLPPRPKSFRFSDASFGSFECAGPSYKFDFSEKGRDFQAQVWFGAKGVGQETRKETLSILDSFHSAGG